MKRLISSLALVLFSVLGASGIAYADTCANAQTSYTGDITIGDSGTACSISHAVTATGQLTVLGTTISTKALTGGTGLTVTASGATLTTTTLTTNSGGNIAVTSMGSVTTTAISSAGSVDINSNFPTSGDTKITGAVTATSGYVQIRAGGLIKVTGAVKSTANGNILLIAQSTLQTGNVTGATGSNVDIQANQGGGSSLFTIGGSGQTNGVNGTITAKAGSIGGAIYVVNGTSSSTGGITVTDSTNVSVTGTVLRYLILNAQKGPLNMPTGTIAVNGGSGVAGQIQLLAQTVTFADNATLSAMQTSTTQSLHGVAISATNINYGATSLTIIGDGNGTSPNGGFAYFLAQGNTTISDNLNVMNSQIMVNNVAFQNQTALNVSGSGFLKMTANGTNTKVLIDAYPISFSGGQVLLQATGTANNHVVQIINPVPFSNKVGLTFGGTASVTLDASGTSSDGGIVEVDVDQAVISSPTFICNANAASGNHVGGTVDLSYKTLSLGGATVASTTANGGSTGGNGGDIQILGNGTLNLGSGAGKFNLTATASSGTSGTIEIGFADTLNVDGSAASVAAMGSNTIGGTINIHNIGTLNFVPSAATALAADGGGAGKGGSITLDAFNAITIGGAANQVSLSARGDLNSGTGNGGSVSINSHFSSTTISGGSINVAGGTNKTGGSISVTTSGQLTVTGTLSADAKGTGTAGTITLQEQGLNLVSLDNSIISASGDPQGSGAGGTIQVTSANGVISVAGAKINANGSSAGGTGTGGSITITSGPDELDAVDLTQANTFLNAVGGLNGPGGKVVINHTIKFVVHSVITVDAGSGVVGNTSINDGSIQLNGVTCQQWQTSESSWLTRYWNCITPTQSTSISLAPAQLANGLNATVRGQLGTSKVEVYEFTGLADYNSFFQFTEMDEIGDTVVSNNPPFTQSSIFPPNPTANNMQEVTAHELGHTEDTNAGTQSTDPLYNTFQRRDMANLDYSTVGNGPPPASVIRDACATFNGKPGPFAGATDDNLGIPICPGGVLNNHYKTNGVAWSNSKIAQAASPSMTLLAELYAQSFSIQVFVNSLKPTPSAMLDQTMDILVVENGYMACTAAWAANRATGSTGHPGGAPAECSVDPGAWYIPGQ